MVSSIEDSQVRQYQSISENRCRIQDNSVNFNLNNDCHNVVAACWPLSAIWIKSDMHIICLYLMKFVKSQYRDTVHHKTTRRRNRTQWPN